ncbi:MAG: ROK family protein [Deltaproteobacteria bacterium]|jgi:glucokinase|nr:ROK family protein [Deltaproteobacteria bacterium]
MLANIQGNDDTFLALDIGGTYVKSGLITRRGEILSFHSFPTSEGQSPTHLLELIIGRLKDLRSEAGSKRAPKALGIGAPGWIKPKEGVLALAPNIPGWKDLPITRLMSQALKIPAVLENDANLYGLGEWLAGAGRGHENLIVLTLGTGVGGGLILEGRLWSGSFASAAEIGHIPLGGERQRLCGCGRLGCLETVASTNGMRKIAIERVRDGEPTRYRGDLDLLDTSVMVELAQEGDPLSTRIFAEAGEAIGWVLAGVFNLLGLEAAVIGGGGAGAFDFILPSLKKVLSHHMVTATFDEIRVVKGALGGNAPLVGAAALLNNHGF